MSQQWLILKHKYFFAGFFLKKSWYNSMGQETSLENRWVTFWVKALRLLILRQDDAVVEHNDEPFKVKSFFTGILCETRTSVLIKDLAIETNFNMAFSCRKKYPGFLNLKLASYTKYWWGDLENAQYWKGISKLMAWLAEGLKQRKERKHFGVLELGRGRMEYGNRPFAQFVHANHLC